MLTRRLAKLIGKPGAANAPLGVALNQAANECARIVSANCAVQCARHSVRIGDLALYEAFPSSFLGLMLQHPAQIATKRGNRSDLFFEHLCADATIERLCADLLPNRTLAEPLATVINHDDRAALICALTALAITAADFTAVGDETDGWIILPPARFLPEWARAALQANASDEPKTGGRLTFTPGARSPEN